MHQIQIEHWTRKQLIENSNIDTFIFHFDPIKHSSFSNCLLLYSMIDLVLWPFQYLWLFFSLQSSYKIMSIYQDLEHWLWIILFDISLLQVQKKKKCCLVPLYMWWKILHFLKNYLHWLYIFVDEIYESLAYYTDCIWVHNFDYASLPVQS